MEEMKIKTTIKVGNRFLTPWGIGRNGLGTIDCLAEVVANCFDWSNAKLNPPGKVKIQVIFGDNYIHIRDNGAGMTLQELDTAINLAEADDAMRERLNESIRKGMYGMGLKIATLTLGWKFSINTVSYKNPANECFFQFDARNLINTESTYLDEGLEIIHRLVSTEGPLKGYTHGTSIFIEDLVKRERPGMNAVKDELEERFIADINNLLSTTGLEFEIIENSVSHQPLILKAEKKDISRLFQDEVLKTDFAKPSRWADKKYYSYKGMDGKQYVLEGFLQLLEKRSVADQKFGLNLYYNGQLIERFHKNELLTTFGRGAEKTYGELHLNGCTPDPSKKKFIIDDAFLAVRDLISNDLQFYKNLTPASGDAMARIRTEIAKRKGIIDAISEPGPLENTGSAATGGNEPSPGTKTDPMAIPSHFPAGTIKVKERLFIHITKEAVIESSLDKSRGVNWESAYLRSKEHIDLMILKVYINPDSELFKAVDELYDQERDKNKITDFYKRIAICECIYDKLIEEHQISPEDAREITDKKVYPQVLKLKNLK